MQSVPSKHKYDGLYSLVFKIDHWQSPVAEDRKFNFPQDAYADFKTVWISFLLDSVKDPDRGGSHLALMNFDQEYVWDKANMTAISLK